MHKKFDINTYFEELVNSKDETIKEIKPPIVKRQKHAEVYVMGPVEVKPMPRSSSTDGICSKVLGEKPKNPYHIDEIPKSTESCRLIDLISDHLRMEGFINNTISDSDRYSSIRPTKEFPMPRTYGSDSLRHARTYSSYGNVDLTEVFNREIQVANSVVGGRSRGYPTFGDYPISSIGLGGNPCAEIPTNAPSITCTLAPSKETMSEQYYYLDLLEQTVGSTPLYAITFHPEKGKPALYRTGTCYLPYFIATNRIICSFLSSKTHSFFLNLFPTDGTRMTTIKLNAAHIEFSPELVSFLKNALWYKEFGAFPLQDVPENTTVINAPDLLEGL